MIFTPMDITADIMKCPGHTSIYGDIIANTQIFVSRKFWKNRVESVKIKWSGHTSNYVNKLLESLFLVKKNHNFEQHWEHVYCENN